MRKLWLSYQKLMSLEREFNNKLSIIKKSNLPEKLCDCLNNLPNLQKFCFQFESFYQNDINFGISEMKLQIKT